MTTDDASTIGAGPDPGEPGGGGRYSVYLEFVATRVDPDGVAVDDPIRARFEWPPMPYTALVATQVALHRMLADLLRLGARRALVREHDPAKRAFLAAVAEYGPEAGMGAALDAAIPKETGS